MAHDFFRWLQQSHHKNRMTEFNLLKEESASTTASPCTIKVFYDYVEEDRKHLNKLNKHMATLKNTGCITTWQESEIQAGVDREQEIMHTLDSTHIILMLLSADFMNSKYPYDPIVQRAFELHYAGLAQIIPILLRPTDLQGTPFAGMQLLPDKRRSVTEWRNQDEAFVSVVTGIRLTIEHIHALEKNR